MLLQLAGLECLFFTKLKCEQGSLGGSIVDPDPDLHWILIQWGP
jgi:hypothetical protein